MNSSQEEVKNWNLVVIVDNEPGVLSGISGMFAARGYNIESLTVCSVDKEHKYSRINIVTEANKTLANKIMFQIERLIPVRSVDILENHHEGFVAKEITLVKVVCDGVSRREALRIATIFEAKVSDTTLNSFLFVVVGSSAKIDAFVELMRDLGKTEVSRSGVVAMQRGTHILET